MNEFNLDARVTVSADPAETSLSPAVSVASRVVIRQTIKRTIAMSAACAAVRTNGKC
ncbi:hypothetical protein [Streptomyces sp. NPDC051211]|uniref:hypothetical protein n=1 Tax=Streptomyces sp. NPDC051211 TaxID=3154643 RepID=UPI00344E7093